MSSVDLLRRRAALSAIALAVTLALGASPAGAAFRGGNGRIVFSSDRPSQDGSTDFELYSMMPDGSDLRRLTYNAYLPPGAGEEGEGEEGCGGGKGGAGAGGSGGSGGASGAEGAGEEEAKATPIDDIQPAVSPDGRQVAFASNRLMADGSAHTEIYVMRTDGTKVRPVTGAGSFSGGPKSAFEPAWSPDGKQIVFRRGEGAKADLWVIDLATRRLTKIKTAYERGPAGYDAQPAWSPDGSEIAFVKGSGRAADIWVYHVYGPRQGESLPLIHALNVAETSPSWSPDGKRIAYARGDLSAGAGIWVANADGGDQHPVTQPSPDAEGKAYSDLSPRFSPDGREIVFESTRNGIPGTVDLGETEGECSGGGEGEEGPEGAIELFKMSADGSHVVQLTKASSVEGPQDVGPDWQPIPQPAPPPPEVPSQQQLAPPVVEVPVVSQGTSRCVPLRSFKVAIRLTKLDRRHMRYVRARVNGRRVKVRVHRRWLKVRVNAKRAVKGRLTIEVYVMLRHGKHLWGRRTFRRCDGHRPDGVQTFHLQRHRRHGVFAPEHR